MSGGMAAQMSGLQSTGPSKGDSSLNQCIQYIQERAISALESPAKLNSQEKMVKLFNEESNRQALELFVKDVEKQVLVVYTPTNDKLVCTTDDVPKSLKKKAVYFIKSKNIVDSLRLEDLKTDVVCGELTDSGLETLSLLSHEVFFPLLSNPANRSGWSGPTSKELMLKFSNFLSNLTMTLGQSKGQTLLPYPPPEAFDEDNLPEKERIHLLETSLVQWTNKIQDVLAADPESIIKQGAHPDPLVEIEFWAAKAGDLNSLHDQLNSEKMRTVLETLRELKSALAPQFEKLGKEVEKAKHEAAENTRYLRALKPWFKTLRNEMDFFKLEQLLLPMFHTILLIWQQSPPYAKKHRLITLIQEISNGFIFQAQKNVSGSKIFQHIENDETLEALALLTKTIAVLEKLKKTFAQHQEKAAKVLQPADAWDVPKEVIFARLDAFIERAQDISEFTKIVLEFSKLEKIFLGGTKGGQLTTLLHALHEDFVHGVQQFQRLNYDVMDINATQFDDDFYRYRCQVKDMERRLAAIIISAFDDASTISGRFKLLDSFEGLLDRPIIKDELDKKKDDLLRAYSTDLHAVQHLFITYKDRPRIDVNLPPVAGALSWVRGLLERIKDPMNKLKAFLFTPTSGKPNAWAAMTAGPDGLKEEKERKVEKLEWKEVEKVYNALCKQLEQYELRKIEEWTKEIDATSEEKLQQCLLRRDRESRRLHVNFDDALVRLLREVKYFLLLKLNVPPTAFKIFGKADIYRTQIGNLETIVKMYNEMMDTLLPVERPLVEKEIAHIDDVIERGITRLSWNFADVNDFIAEAMTTVKAVYSTVKVMKDNMEAIKKMMSEFAAQPLAERKNKPLPPADFDENLKKLWKGRYETIAEHQERITKLLAETKVALKVNQGSPIWRAYAEYVQDNVRDYLAQCIVNSLKFFADQLDPAYMEKHVLSTLLEIKIGLYANDVGWSAEDNTSADEKAPRKSRRDVWQIISDWVEGFFEIGNIMTRQDSSHYVGDLKKHEPIVKGISHLKKLLDANQKDCDTYKQEYSKYDFLWKTDRNIEFQKFLQRALAQTKEEAAKKESEEKKKTGMPESKKAENKVSTPRKDGKEEYDSDDDKKEEDGEGSMTTLFTEILPLDKFEKEIQRFKDLASEINNKKNVVDISFLRINAVPVKTALQTWCSRWINTYTSFLYNDVTRKLNMLEQLQKEVNQGLQEEVSQGDSATLKKVLGYIHKVRSVEKSTTRMFQPLKESVALLKKYGRTLDEYELRSLSEAPMKWDATVNMVYKVKEKVNTLQNDEVDKIKEKVMEFENELKSFRRDFRNHAPFLYDIEYDDAYDLLTDFHRKINKMEEKANRLTDLEKVFELPVSKHTQIKKTRHDNKLLKMVWDMVSVIRCQFEDWKKTLWDRIDTDNLMIACKKLQYEVDNMPPEVKSWNVYQGLLAEVRNFLTVLPLVNLLHSPSMEERHWTELKKLTGKNFEKNSTFSLAHLLDLELHKYVNEVEYIVELANKESKIAASLKKIQLAWDTLNLEFGVRKQVKLGGEAKDGQVEEIEVGTIKQPDEILLTLEENMAALQGMMGQGKNVEFFIEEVKKWQKILGMTESVLYDWLEVQAKWGGLQAIFTGSQDIRVQLPEDTRRFMEIDAQWKELMSRAKETPRVIDACSSKDRSELLMTMKVGLEQCEKSLFQYLESKRRAFPRFYFLPDSALLDILSNGTNPQAVQKHLGDCFDNIAKLKFENDESGTPNKTAIGMFSKDGDEYVDLSKPFHCVGPVEDWLSRLVLAMRDTLADILSKAKFTADQWEIERPRHKWLFGFPAQVALTASQIIWSEEVNSQFESIQDGNEQAMKEYSKVILSRLDNLIQLVLGELSPRDRIKVMTLITVDVHNRDVVAGLIDNKIQDPNAWQWQSQMRFKWKADSKECFIKVCDATFNYSYEYIGNTPRLVITPLTDRCYITLTQALRLIMGGAPAGPAGTGKTETTKDLGRAMGLPVYVFNCSEQMNVQSMGAIFKGLCQTGAWGCFDEFNRIPIEVLSVISTQFSTVLNALREKREEFDFMGEMIKVVPTMGCFITMNPGYAGRTELPGNLKALFRSCAMVVPDMQLICENMLMSEGFFGAQGLSKKFTQLYQLSSELLSKQIHYDWGLRACKAVLMVAGSLKRAESHVKEDRILMRALRDFNMPKLVDEDKPIYKELIEDLFPGLSNTERKFDVKLQDALRKVATENGLQPEETFLLKCIELAELLAIRHSVFIIGPAGAGKSEIWKTLVGAFRDTGIETVYEVMNPKAVENNELFGWLSKTDWHDGILSTTMRNMSRNNAPYNAQQKYKWVVLDGDIDPDWIESLNSVMDDNKVLTLVSNERIPFTREMRLVFEIDNLLNATPATVSRAGILFINAKDVGSKPFLDSWIESRENDKEKSSLLALFNKYCTPEYLNEIRTSFKRIISLTEINMIRTLCFLLEGLLARLSDDRKKRLRAEEKIDPQVEKDLFEANFAFAVIWAFGGAVLSDKQHDLRAEFSEWWKRVHTTVKFPKEGTVFDYYPHPKTGKMVPWVVPEYVPIDSIYQRVFVPTVDTVRTSFLLDLLVSGAKPVLLVGTAGTGKTGIVSDFLSTLGENYMSSAINLNSYTDAKSLQRIMEGYIDKRVGRTYGPTGNKKLIYFLDDINMPKEDKYGTQTPLALLRQHMDYEAWYDTAKLELKHIQDVQYLACMNPTAGSFTIQERLQSKFATFAILLPNVATLTSIYHSILNGHLKSFHKDVAGLTDVLVKATIELHDAVSLKFMPSSKKFHYQFNLRDLSAIVQGLCLSTHNYDAKTMVRLWEHECTRVFSDRLVTPKDTYLFDELLQSKTKNYFKQIVSPDGKINLSDEKQELKPGQREDGPLIFSSFASASYLPVGTMERLRKVLQHRLVEYNSLNPQMNLELFDNAMEHISRIVRIIENPRGNALLVGVGGSGKQSLAKLASFICGYHIFQIQVTQSYGLHELKTDLQDLYRKAGVKNMPITFLLTESQILDERWLVYVNDLLSSGYIPDLFTSEDKDGIFSSLRNEAKAAGVADTREAMQEFFINRVRSNLHVVLCFSPVGEQFRLRCRKFPGLINCTSIDWFHPWPKDALVSVGMRFLQDTDVGGDAARQQVAEHMAFVHLSVSDASTQYLEVERRFNYTTPKSFLELISFYKQLLGKKRADLMKQTARLQKGIRTLQETHARVEDLKVDLTRTNIKLGEKAEASTVLIGKMAVERKKVEEQQGFAQIEAQKAKSASEVAEKISEECNKDLEAALPILNAAKDALNVLSKQSLGVLRGFNTPPGNCLLVTNACLILLNIPGKRDWPSAKKMMQNLSAFLDQLKAFDANNIDDGTLAKLKPILDQEVFNPVEMKSVSEAAANLCTWVVNTVRYNAVYRNVAPKIAAQKKAAEEQEIAQAKLRVVEEKVAAVQAKFKQVTDALDAANAEKKQVEDDAKNCQLRLDLAKRLVEGLADENTRWGKSIGEMQEKARSLAGDSLLAAAFVSYIGAFNQSFRQDLWKEKWLPDLINRKVYLTPNVDPLFVLASESDFAKWKNESLADDRMSLENGAIITNCHRWPLLIDPQQQGIKWIRNRVRDLRTVQLNQKKWLDQVVKALREGATIVIENLNEEIDAALDPVLSRSIIQRGYEKYIKLGNDEVPFDDNFRLFLQTKLSNPHYKPEIAAQCTIINFIVTEEGLEEQLLALVVNKEKPDLEEKRTQLVRAINDYMVSLTDLENELLERLSNAPEDILSDVELIKGLEKTKQQSTEVEIKVEQAKKSEVIINAARNEFKPVSAEASWLYFLLIQLCNIDYMYQYSLDAFISFFVKAMVRAKKAEKPLERVANLRESIRSVIFTWVNRGLFEKHKLIFAAQLCFKLMQKGVLKEAWNPTYFDFLVRCPKKMATEKPLDWLPLPAWNAIGKLVELDGFQKLAADMIASPNRFKEWYNKPRPESSPLPLDWRKLDDTNPFMKLLIVRAMRPDRMTTAMENFVRDQLPNGRTFVEVDAGKSFLDVLSLSLDDTSPTSPIFFILSAGADPVYAVEVLAKKNGIYDGRFHRVALGQGQDVVAMNKLELGHKEGHWVVLENIHLMPKWNLELEKRLDEYALQGSNSDFRIFLSAEPSEGIPQGILERSIKLTNEPPQGLKQNLKRAFASFEKDEFEFKDPKVKSILFGLCHFHSIIIERIKFGSKGWNRLYPFNTGDLMNSSTVLMNYLENATADKIPWNDLRYIFGEILYGGHITDDWDRGLCMWYLKFYMREELLDEMELFPFNDSFPEERFRAPPVLPYDQYFEYIDAQMQNESPVAFGMHPNAEIAVKTQQAEDFFQSIMDLQPRVTAGAGGDSSTTSRVAVLLQSIIEKTKNIRFSIDELAAAVVDERGPYQNVFLQECDRMNQLVHEIQRSLQELDLGLSGELQMSERMENLQRALFLNRVPASWARLAYPSERSLASWVENLLNRASQLQTWTEEPAQVPTVVNLSYFFNPQSFLTAIMQKTAQKQKLELDKLVIHTEVTRKSVEQTDTRARDGAYIHGLSLDGARWNWNAGQMEECLPREMFCPLPVILCRAMLGDKVDKAGFYKCPVYKTQKRGNTFVFMASLRSKLPQQKWILAGAALIMEQPDD